jgi:hypothetical protein
MSDKQQFLYLRIDRYEGGANTITKAKFKKIALGCDRKPVVTKDGHVTYDFEEEMVVAVKL